MNSSKESCAFKMNYSDGAPVGKMVPSAGKEGTIVKLEDLFYSMPSRKRAFEGSRKESEEYQKILNIVQRYSVHTSRRGIGFVCRKKGGATDLNTTSIASVKKLKRIRLNHMNTETMAEEKENNNISDIELNRLRESCTKEVIGHIYSNNTARELLSLECGEGNIDEVTIAALQSESTKLKLYTETKKEKSSSTTKECNFMYDGLVIEKDRDHGAMVAKESLLSSNASGEYSFAYKAHGFITNASYCVPKASSAFLLFINNRLVQSASLKRSVEGIYLDMLPRGAKPFVYLSLELPAPQMDVNVHPTKREVAFLHEDRLCDALATAVRERLRSNNTSRTFVTQTLLSENNNLVLKQPNKKQIGRTGVEREQKDAGDSIQGSRSHNTRKENSLDEDENTDRKKRRISREKEQNAPKRYDPKNFIRTNAAAEQGALEPFLVPTQPKKSQLSQDTRTTKSKITSTIGVTRIEHSPDCELAGTNRTIDLSVPGAFASICRCQVEQAALLPPLPKTSNNTTNNVVRPKKIEATKCSYTSIETLRKDIQYRSHGELTSKLRNSIFVGCINRKRCLLQSGIELLLVNYFELSKEMFCQLSLLRFGGFQMAELSEGVNVKVLIEESLQSTESDGSCESLSKNGPLETIAHESTNSKLASQATQCLMDQVEMLLEYFSIRLEMKQDPQNDSNQEILMLTGLPIILDGHSPSPHALPTFLHRLVTEVNWKEERMCFEGICIELGNYYAQFAPVAGDGKITSNEDDKLELISESEKKHVQHTLFPALRYLLVLPKDFADDGSFCKLALLSKLYKVFERC